MGACSQETMSNYKGSFSYKNDNVNTIVVNPDMTAKIERINNNIARIYLVDSHNVQVPFPPNLTIVDSTGQLVPPFQDNVLITWVDSYVMRDGNVDVFQLDNQKQQSLRAAPGTACSME